ncbi:type VII secretion protein EccC [Paractinoplanes deccanensis]|uniref:Type VII secretion protein EccC n=1 Tax=Paractinoplanes deccanensis TaxID=113561 RepID=A0ABQ3XX95_9ACTN|nr:type VII secretion protein EccCa [Actinoplanes deccanensis]GID72371.1 type VII secretion protein EccC [Actinoplanes deccanensis]
MTRKPFHRPARPDRPGAPEGRITVPAPPPLTRATASSSWLTMMLPLLSTVAMAGYLISYGRPLLIMLGVGFVVLSLVATLGMRWQARHNAEADQRRHHERYLHVLHDVRLKARETAAVSRHRATVHQPSPRRLLALVSAGRRTWERRPADSDFLRVRIGEGRGPLAGGVELGGRMDPMADYDRDLLAEAEAVVADHRTVGGQPAWIDLARCGVVSLVGDERETRALARSLVVQVAALHAPEDVTIAVHTGGADGWEWAKWLPHTHEPGAASPSGVSSLVAADFGLLADFLERERDRAREEVRNRRAYGPAPVMRRLVLVLDGYRPGLPWTRTPILESLWTDAGPELGITVVCLAASQAAEPTRVDARATVEAGGSLRLSGPSAERYAALEAARPDLSAAELCEAIARRLAPLRLGEEREPVLSRITTLPEMLGVPDIGLLDPRRDRVRPDDPDMLRVPLGLDGNGDPVLLDLKESAQQGMGPHGLVVGATGSGKSELLRTLVTGLAAKHAPEHLSLVLIDFKGGATFAGVTELPHVSGLITNLADDLAMVDRVRAALQGEQQRRQRMLREAGNVDSVREYQIRQAAGGVDVDGKPLEPLPYLLVMVDEFGELLSVRPDFIDLFVQIGRVGRSLGMHLLLATQRLEESRLRGLQSHLSYRLCLRTFSAAESRAVIGTPDAYHLPPVPGSAYLKVDESIYTRFRVAHVSGAYAGNHQEDSAARTPVTLVPFTLRSAAVPVEEKPARAIDLDGRTELQVAVARLRGTGEAVHQVWLPPLGDTVPLGGLLGELTRDAHRGLSAAAWPAPGGLMVPVGLLDLPGEQRQDPMVADLSGKDGNVAVVGAPQSGKSVLLRSLLTSMMLTGTPDEVQLSIVDCGGGALLSLAKAPHVTGAASRLEPDRARRLVAEALRLVVEREQLFRDEGIDSVATFRRAPLPDGTRRADLFLVIDNWAALRADLPDLEETVVELAARGLGVGVHLVLSANRWVEIRANLRDSIGGRVELRLNDPYESEVGRAFSRQLLAAPPGRGVLAPGVFFQTAVAEDVVAGLAAAWTGAAAPAVRMLPSHVSPDTLPAGAIGLDEVDLAPVSVTAQHFLAFGDSGSGKTSFLRAWMRSVTEVASDDEARFMVVDYRRGLLGAVPDGYIGAYAGDPAAAAAYAGQLTERLAERRPPSTVTAAELQARSWWTGPELYLVVDDLDMVASDALAPLLPFLMHARDIGFHVIAAHRSAGASRALLAGSLAGKVAEMGADGLVMSGEAREGALLGGVRPGPLPPGRGVLVRRGKPPVLIQVAASAVPAVGV